MTVYCKTEIGQHEVRSRAHALPAKARQALIMVDGKREDSELCQLIVDEEHSVLDTLLDLGLIEPATAVAAPQQPQHQSRKTVSLDSLRRAAVRALTEALGPEAEAMALRIERTKSIEDLAAAIEQAAHLVRNALGDDAGIGFAAKLGR